MPGIVTKTTSGGYSARIAIRGAGIKAPCGVREISVLRDGVPVTDPDGFSKLDFIDPQDIPQVEVVKGPGSIYSYGSSGDTIQILSRSVFDPGSDRIRVSGGSYDSNTQNIRYSGNITDDDFYALTWSRQDNSNSWRENNDYMQNNGSIKYGHLFEDDSKFEIEIAYTNSNLQLPQDYLQPEYIEWASGGGARWDLTSSNYRTRHRARDSQVVFFNSSLEKSFGDLTIKSRFYVNYWDYFHPTSGVGSIPKQLVIGGDFQVDWDHQLFDRDTKMIVGAIGRNDRGRSETYNYADVETQFRFGTTRLFRTLSERPGQIQNYGEEDNFYFGAYLQYTFKPLEKLTADMSFRYDRIMFNITRNEINKFNFGTYLFSDQGRGLTNIDTEYDVISSRFGLTFELTEELNTYFNFGYGDQVPGAGEVRSNLLAGRSADLVPSSTYNYEAGFKFRHQYVSLDVAFYYANVLNEILSGKDAADETYYINAGSSEKLGLEVAAEVYVPYVEGLSLGVNYTWNDHVISEWTFVDQGVSTVYDGNTFNKIPRHMYSLFANYRHPSGISASVRSRIQSKYWKNNENRASQAGNSAIYGGLNFITDVTLSYSYKGHTLQGNMNNIFDKHYASDANISSLGERFESERYKLASPRRLSENRKTYCGKAILASFSAHFR